MKSITIKNIYGDLALKIIKRKNGKYDLIKDPTLNWTIEVRDDKNCKVYFKGEV